MTGTTLQRPPGRVLPKGHAGPCGERLVCWREECRIEFGRYRTVEQFQDGRVIARCHGGSYGADDVIARRIAP